MPSNPTPVLMPCPFCGEQPEIWDGLGTQASIECGECGCCSVGVQVSDVMTYEERHASENAFNKLKYPDWAIERANEEMRQRWNTRAHDPRLTELERDLAECYRLSGADPDGNEDWRLASSAVQEVARLRKESDDDTNTIVNLERENAALRDLLILAERAMGDHHAPSDCYSTGPLNGDASDLLCPACEYQRARIASVNNQRGGGG